MMGQFVLSKQTFIVTKDTSYPATRPDELKNISEQVFFHWGMLIYSYQNIGIGGWLFQAKGNV